MVLRSGLCHIACHQHRTLVEWSPPRRRIGEQNLELAGTQDLPALLDPARDKATQVLWGPHVPRASREHSQRPESAEA